MSLLVVGSIGIDNVETPNATRFNVLGGSASYFAYAASFFTRVGLVGVVGSDFPPEFRKLFRQGAAVAGQLPRQTLLELATRAQ